METAPLSSEDEALIERIMETNEHTFDPEFLTSVPDVQWSNQPQKSISRSTALSTKLS